METKPNCRYKQRRCVWHDIGMVCLSNCDLYQSDNIDDCLRTLANELLERIDDCEDHCPLYIMKLCNGKPDKSCTDMLIEFARGNPTAKETKK